MSEEFLNNALYNRECPNHLKIYALHTKDELSLDDKIAIQQIQHDISKSTSEAEETRRETR